MDAASVRFTMRRSDGDPQLRHVGAGSLQVQDAAPANADGEL